MTLQYQKISNAKNWKDKAVGWSYWNVKYVCQECGKSVTEHVHGTEAQIKDYCSHVVNAVCEKCQST